MIKEENSLISLELENSTIDPIFSKKRTKRISIGHKKTNRQQIIFLVAMIISFILALNKIDLNFSHFQEGKGKIGQLFMQLLSPDLSVLPAYLSGLGETLAIAFLGLMISIFTSIFLVFLTANNTTPNKYLAKIIKFIMSGIRSIPITIWGLIAAASIGFGSLAGVFGLFFPTTAYLVRTLAERVEEGGNDTIEALSSCGATWLEITLKGVLVQLTPQFLASIILRYELSVSETIGLGMVGVAGIGYRLSMAIGTYKFSVASTGIIVIFVTMLFLEFIAKNIINKIR